MCFGKKPKAGSTEPAARVTLTREQNVSPQPRSKTPATLKVPSSAPSPSSPSSPSSPTSPTGNPRPDQPKDDATIIGLFRLIDSSITDHVLNYYISNSSGSEKFSEFGKDKEHEWVLHAAHAPLMNQARTQVGVIRAIIGYQVFKAIRDDFFVPSTYRKLAAKKQTRVDPSRRLDYFQSLSSNPRYHQHRETAVESLANDILTMTRPLAASTDRAQEQARLKNLKHIAENAAEFAITVGKQKPSFEIIFPSISTSSTTSMSRENSRSRTTRRGNRVEELPVIVPELRKYGDERGKNYGQSFTLIPVLELPKLS